MAFVGVAPLDPTTLVGQSRSLIGDRQYTSNPDGTGNYGYFSDADILVLLGQGDQNPLRAAALAFRQLAASFAMQEAVIAGDDLKANTTSRSVRLESLADKLDERADAQGWFSLTNTGDGVTDLRDYMYPTGDVILSELFWGIQDSVGFPGAF